MYSKYFLLCFFQFLNIKFTVKAQNTNINNLLATLQQKNKSEILTDLYRIDSILYKQNGNHNHVDEIIEKRKIICETYDSLLNFSKLNKLKIRENVEWNYSYYPVIFETEKKLLQLQQNTKRCWMCVRYYLQRILKLFI